MLRNELEAYLNAYLNVSLFKDYCPNGLQVEGKKEIRRCATAVSADLMTIQKAVDEHLDALIVHHGLFWQHDPYPLIGSKKEKIQLLLHHGISLFAYHLPLDAHVEVGNNWVAARKLGWNQLEPFGNFNGVMIGVKGAFESRSVQSLIVDLEAFYRHPATVALGGKSSVSTSALISGGAYKEIAQAAQAGLDCFITGNFDEPAWAMAYEGGVNFMALGHSATEVVGPEALSMHIQNQLGLSCRFLHVPNPF